MPLFLEVSSEQKSFAFVISNDDTNFNSTAAPHFVRKREAGVKSMKYHLKRVIVTTLFTYEEMSTLLMRIDLQLSTVMSLVQ